MKRREEEKEEGNERGRTKRTKTKQTKKSRRGSVIQNLENICIPNCKYIFYTRVNFRTMHIQNDKN
jgi:hypothetical protein